MEHILVNNSVIGSFRSSEELDAPIHNLAQAKLNVEYTIKGIVADDEELKNFLFTLGCYEGEQVTVISVLSENYIIHVKDARYSIESELARAILV